MGNKRGHITREERFCIEKLLAAGDSYRDIALHLGRGLSTISQEVARCGGRKGYTASSAHKGAKHRQWYKKRSCLKVALDPYLCRRIETDIRGHISPERISGRLRLEGHPYASPKAIRRFAHSRHFESYLYRKGLNRRRRGWGKARQERFAGRIFVDDPRCVRTGYGHWEGDFIVSSVSTPVLLVLVERRTKETIIRWIRNRTNERVYRVIEEALAGKHVASLAVDNEIAFAQHRVLSSRLGRARVLRAALSLERQASRREHQPVDTLVRAEEDRPARRDDRAGQAYRGLAQHRAAPVSWLLFLARSDRTVYDVQCIMATAGNVATMKKTMANGVSNDRAALLKQAFALEYITLGWMTIEAVVAIVSGIAANSLTLTAFGVDSVIELASAVTLLWRLSVESRHGQELAEAAERKAARIGAVLLFALAAFVTINAVWKLWTQQGAEFSAPGLAVSVLAMPIMYVLSRRKLILADAMGSPALRADAVESITCGWLSLVVAAALVAQLLLGAWWVDAVASLGIVWFLVREGREAWEGEECCRD